MVLSVVGFVGVVRVNTCLHFLHAFFCCSILGAFYIYLLLDFFLSSTSEASHPEKLSDTMVLLLMSLPYLLMFLIGCHSMYLLNMLLDEKAARRQD